MTDASSAPARAVIVRIGIVPPEWINRSTLPIFRSQGAWFQVGAKQRLHLIVHTDPTFRRSNIIDTRDVHFAVRVKSYRQALEFLRSKGYREDAADGDPRKMKANPRATAGFPQVYILDPDRHVIEINAETLD